MKDISTPRSQRFLKACRREKTDCTPIWIMRQAGRYLEEYRELRKKYKMLEMAKDPDLATEVTLQPIRRFELDAAIVFSDILVPAWGLGIPFRIEEKIGPRIETPLRTEAQIRGLRRFEAQRDVPYLLKTIRQVRRELNGKVPLLGFSGAPFTLGSYLIEGGSSKNFRWTKSMMHSGGSLWPELMNRLTDTVVEYLRAQIEAGAQAVQLFDSWVGHLSPDDYERYVFPYSRRIFQELSGMGVPTIHFGTGTATLLEKMTEAGGDVIGVDWCVRLDEAWKRIGYERAIQGNLDSAILFADPKIVKEEARAVLDRAGSRPGHIFNLGHGILPETPVDTVKQLIDFVHEYTARPVP